MLYFPVFLRNGDSKKADGYGQEGNRWTGAGEGHPELGVRTRVSNLLLMFFKKKKMSWKHYKT